ncbi:MAG TPA: AzlC family ABC transporter permease [Gammaproteobacteria bacterium]|nr:AzlC family ABC transporter permease [Gammaproteobacteria bacterium]
MQTSHSFSAAFRATWPVLFGYVPLGLAFGVLFVQLGYPWYYATLMAATVYAGAAQFMAVGLLAAGAGLLEIGLATLLLNARHIFYGLSLAPRFPTAGLSRLYLMFGLTDETYALLTSSNPPAPEAAPRFYLQITALNQFYWIAGCTLGALLGAAITLDTRGLEFTLTALFVVLLVEQARAVRDPRPFLVALASGAVALFTVGSEHMLLVALGLATLLLFLNRRDYA